MLIGVLFLILSLIGGFLTGEVRKRRVLISGSSFGGLAVLYLSVSGFWEYFTSFRSDILFVGTGFLILVAIFGIFWFAGVVLRENVAKL
jgi:hypothetical protein